jgi:hypothetical protein
MPELSPQTRDKLKKVATPTLMTALYRRGLRNQWIQDVHLINPAATPMVGIAFTLRYIPAREDLNKLEVFRDRNHPQRQAVVAELPVLEILSATHIIADLTLGLGKVIYDYLR